MAKNRFSDILLGYEKDSEYGAKFKTIALTGNVTRTRHKFFTRIIKGAESMMRTLSYSSTRAYGLFLLGFGVLSLILHFIVSYTGGGEIPPYVLISSIIVSLLGTLLVFFDKPLSIALMDFPLTDYIFFEFFCIKRMHRIDVAAAVKSEKEGERVVVIRPFLALVIGLLFAAFTMLIPMWYIVIALVAFVYLFLTFISPEFSLFAIFMSMPYLPTLEYSDVILATLVLVTFVSFFLKVLLGKRVYYFEQYDLLLGVFLLFVLVSGVFVKGVESFGASLVLILFAMGYILSSSLISNRRLADCVINAMIISALPASINAIILAVVEIAENGYRGFEGVSATFQTPSELAVYLLASAVFALYFVRSQSRIGAKLLYLLITALIFAGILATGSTWAFIAGIFGVVAYLATGVRKFGPALVALISLLPYSLLFVGRDALLFLDGLPLLSAIGLDSFGERWEASFEMLSDNLFVGVGIGSDSFMRELAEYSSLVFEDSGNLLLEIGCEAGIFALATFLLIILVRVVHRGVYRKYSDGSQVHHLAEFSSVALSVLLVFGAVNYLWSNLAQNFLFWCIFGIGSAVLRVSKQEKDDRTAYFSDGRSSDSSSIDIDLR